MVNITEQEDFFKLLGANLKEKVEAYVIGGSAMMYHGAKSTTKDIDLVFSNEKDRIAVDGILRKLKFEPRSTRFLYANKKNVPILLQRNEIKVDLFCKKIICFELSEGISKRVNAVYEFGNLIAKVVSPEDIILLKCATERPGDRLDAAELIKNFKIDWDVIIDEASKQTRPGREIFSVFLYDFLMELKEDFKTDIPESAVEKLIKVGENALIKAKKEGTLVRERKKK